MGERPLPGRRTGRNWAQRAHEISDPMDSGKNLY